MKDVFEISLKGDRALDRELQLIAAEDGEKSVNKVCRDIARDSAKRIVMPAAVSLVNVETGFLESQIRVNSLTRSRSKVGATVGLRDPLFTGDAYYGGFQEFPSTDRAGNPVEADSFLRRALYTNERRIRGKFVGDLRRWVKLRNRIARL